MLLLQKCDHFREQVHFDVVVYHSDLSRAEGYPGKIRVSTPAWLGITENDAFSCNYTSQNASAWQTYPPFSNVSWTSYLNLTHAPRTDYFDIEFPHGLTYADIVECNFSMTVDPDKVRLPGSGQTDGQVIFSPVMERRVIDSFPANNGDLQAMGQPVFLEVKMETLDCEDPLVWDTVTHLCPYANTLERRQVCMS